MSLKTRLNGDTRRKSKAQGLLEFALILPILLMVIFAIIDLGWIAFNFSQLYNAAREATRYGSVPGFPPAGGQYQYLDCPAIRNRLVTQAGFSGIKANWTDIHIYYDDGRPASGSVAASGANPAEVVGTCDSAFAQNASYVPQSPSQPHPRNVKNGDRIVIAVDAHVPLLTPFFKAMIQGGVAISFTSARSVFPDGILN
jgi:TadE-like protein